MLKYVYLYHSLKDLPLPGVCILALNRSPHDSSAGKLVTESSQQAERLVERYYTYPKDCDCEEPAHVYARVDTRGDTRNNCVTAKSSLRELREKSLRQFLSKLSYQTHQFQRKAYIFFPTCDLYPTLNTWYCLWSD